MIADMIAILHGGGEPETELELVVGRYGMTLKYARALFEPATGYRGRAT